MEACAGRLFWLDFGGGDAEYVERLATVPQAMRDLFICLDPVLRPHMIAAGRVRPASALPSNVVRVCGGLGPSDDCGNPALPFRSASLQHVTCRFVLHLYLTVVEPFAGEAHRVLVPGGDVSIRLPDLPDRASATNTRYIADTLRQVGFVDVEGGPVADDQCSVWDEVYQGQACELRAAKL